LLDILTGKSDPETSTSVIKSSKKVFLHMKNPQEGVVGANWEGPYIIKEDCGNGAYKIQKLEGKEEKNPWNAEHLRRFYV